MSEPRSPGVPELGTCPGCHAPIAEPGAHFCNRCGHPVTPVLHRSAPVDPDGVRRRRIGLEVALVLIGLVAAAVFVIVFASAPAPGVPAPARSDRAPTPAVAMTPAPGPAPREATLTPGAAVRATVDAAGATLALPAGMTLVVPPGAVAQATEISLRVYDQVPPELARAPRGLVFDGTSTQPRFARPVELVVPLPPEVTAEQAASAISGTYEHGALVIERPVRVQSIGGHTSLVVPMDHFSPHVLVIVGGVLLIKGAFVAYDAIKGWWWAPPASVAPLSIPVYHQGAGPECLAASVTMVTRAIVPGSKEIWRVMEGSGITTHGMNVLWERLGSGLSDEVHRIVGVEPEVNLWQPFAGLDTGPLLGALKRYVKQQLAAGYPVVLSDTKMAMGGSSDIVHAVVLVGYDATGYWAVNPQSFSDSDCAIRKYSEAQLGIDWTLFQTAVTLVVPKQLDPARATLTINVPPHSVWFQTVGGSSSTIYALDWDGGRPGGIRWSQHGRTSAITGAGTPVDVIPGDVTQLYIGTPDPTGITGGLEVMNAESSARQARVTLEIFNITSGTKHPVVLDGNDTVLAQTVDVPGKARRPVSFIIDVMKLRPPTVTTRQAFQVKATVDGGGTPDTATFELMLDPDTGKPLVGVWEGIAFGGGAMTLTITSQSGTNFAGTFELQGTKLGIEGTWEPGPRAWKLELWELGTTPVVKFPAPGSLVPYSGGRLQLTAPGGLLAKRGSAQGSGVDDPYGLVDDYLHRLPAK